MLLLGQQKNGVVVGRRREGGVGRAFVFFKMEIPQMLLLFVYGRKDSMERVKSC